MAKSCSAFGHRTVLGNIDDELYCMVCKIIEMGCNVFYTGHMGDFDRIFTSCVRKAKKNYPNRKIKLICVKPYLTKELNENKQYYYELYDDIIIPEELSGVYYKNAITKRNQWMIDKSDIVLTYTIINGGGAAASKQYALRHNKLLIEL